MEINVIVTPNAKSANVVKIDDLTYKVRVDAPANEGRANLRLMEILADHFDVPKSHVRIIRGSKGRNKLVLITE